MREMISISIKEKKQLDNLRELWNADNHYIGHVWKDYQPKDGEVVAELNADAVRLYSLENQLEIIDLLKE